MGCAWCWLEDKLTGALATGQGSCCLFLTMPETPPGGLTRWTQATVKIPQTPAEQPGACGRGEDGGPVSPQSRPQLLDPSFSRSAIDVGYRGFRVPHCPTACTCRTARPLRLQRTQESRVDAAARRGAWRWEQCADLGDLTGSPWPTGWEQGHQGKPHPLHPSLPSHPTPPARAWLGGV